MEFSWLAGLFAGFFAALARFFLMSGNVSW